MSRIKAAFLCALLAPTAGTAQSETLGQAIADAYQANPRLQSQRAQLRQLDETVIQAASPYRLQLGITGNVSYVQQRQRDFVDEFETASQKSYGASLSAFQILFNGGRTAAQVSAAEADVLSGRERLREVENFILLEVIDSYVSVRRDQELVAIQQDSADSYSRQVEQARARERGGDLTRTDIAQAEAQLLIVQTAVAQARANLEQSRARFAAVVGHNAGVLEPEPPLPGLPESIGAAYKVAETESPTLLQTVLNEQAGKDRIAAARAERRPIITANGSYGYASLNSYDTRDLGRNLSGSVTLTVPILTRGIVDSSVRAAIANQQSLSFTIEDTRRQVDSALLNAWNTSVTARDQYDIGTKAVTAAEAAIEGVKRSFAEGFRSNFEVLDSEQRLLNARVIVATARYERYTSQANLLAYLGRLEAASLEPSSPLYDSAANLRHQRERQFGPLQTVLEPLDKLQKPGGDSRPAPAIPATAMPVVANAMTPPPAGGLVDTLPVGPEAKADPGITPGHVESANVPAPIITPTRNRPQPQ